MKMKMKRTVQFGKTLLLALLVLTASCNKEDDVLIITLQDLTLSIDENPSSGQIVGTVESSSPNGITFSISSQNPNGALSINASTGVLTVANAALFNFETNPVITATIASDKADNTATVTINLNNVNELSTQDFTTSIDENTASGTSLGTVTASGDGTLTFSITSQTPAGAISINSSTGELTVANATLFDFETHPIITGTISVNNSGNIEIITATINLNNVNELSIQNFTSDVIENTASGTSLGTVTASGDGTLTFSITSQTPAGAININSGTGELTIANAALFDFETNPTVTATIAVANSGTIENLTATINLTDAHEVGEYKFGGVIFWVNAAGTEGLVCATIDQSSGIQWYNGSSLNTTAFGKVIGTGQANTTAIINAQGTGSYAAKLCDDLTLNGFSDWFLPSIDELKEMRINKSIIDATSVANSGTAIEATRYWSSTESSESLHAAEAVSFTSSSATFLEFKSANNKVRAIRDWTDF
jgi:hypothetical protein